MKNNHAYPRQNSLQKQGGSPFMRAGTIKGAGDSPGGNSPTGSFRKLQVKKMNEDSPNPNNHSLNPAALISNL